MTDYVLKQDKLLEDKLKKQESTANITQQLHKQSSSSAKEENSKQAEEEGNAGQGKDEAEMDPEGEIDGGEAEEIDSKKKKKKDVDGAVQE